MIKDACDKTKVNLGGLDTSVGFLLGLAEAQVVKAFLERRKDPLNLLLSERATLWVVYHNAGIKQGQVAESLRIKASNMAKIARRIESLGLIIRTQSDHDRRSVFLTLSERGRTYVQGFTQEFSSEDEHLSNKLSRTEIDELIRLLQKLIRQDPVI